jgi:hypothetical protein
MHLKLHPEGVEFLRQFGLLFLFVLVTGVGNWLAYEEGGQALVSFARQSQKANAK